MIQLVAEQLDSYLLHVLETAFTAAGSKVQNSWSCFGIWKHQLQMKRCSLRTPAMQQTNMVNYYRLNFILTCIETGTLWHFAYEWLAQGYL